jgi:UDP-N-acetylmuramoylalanine--D-glutamate ligase
VRHLILIGEAQESKHRALGGLPATHRVKTMKEAVRLARKEAMGGEVVLLSPACSSFDMFKDYKERGKVFKEAVNHLQVESYSSEFGNINKNSEL